jgi:hypothetical protein
MSPSSTRVHRVAVERAQRPDVVANRLRPHGGVDPREEFAFHAQLGDYAHTLRQEGGGVTKAWKPGTPPAEWARG